MAMGLDSELVSSQLKNAGIYGAIISVLLVTIMGLIAYIRSQNKTAAKIYGYRLQERDAYNTALSDSRAAILAQVEASNERNKLTEELIRVISTSNAQADTLNALLKLQFEFLKDDHGRLNQTVGAMNQVISSMADSVRNLATSSQTIQTGVQSLPPMLESLRLHVQSILPRRTR